MQQAYVREKRRFASSGNTLRILFSFDQLNIFYNYKKNINKIACDFLRKYVFRAYHVINLL